MGRWCGQQSWQRGCPSQNPCPLAQCHRAPGTLVGTALTGHILAFLQGPLSPGSRGVYRPGAVLGGLPGRDPLYPGPLCHANGLAFTRARQGMIPLGSPKLWTTHLGGLAGQCPPCGRGQVCLEGSPARRPAGARASHQWGPQGHSGPCSGFGELSSPSSRMWLLLPVETSGQEGRLPSWERGALAGELWACEFASLQGSVQTPTCSPPGTSGFPGQQAIRRRGG